jgi:hypothetical protein
MDTLNDRVDRMLDAARPARYDSSDKDWMAEIEAAIAGEISIVEARQIAARDVVRKRETEATKSANRLLRSVFRDGQPPLGWLDMAARPIAWGSHRVRLDEANADDFEAWADEENRRADADYGARMEAVKGARLVADSLRSNGARHVGAIWSPNAAA